MEKEPTKAMGDFVYNSFNDKNFGVEKSGAGFFVSSIGTRAKEISKEVSMNK